MATSLVVVFLSPSSFEYFSSNQTRVTYTICMWNSVSGLSYSSPYQVRASRIEEGKHRALHSKWNYINDMSFSMFALLLNANVTKPKRELSNVVCYPVSFISYPPIMSTVEGARDWVKQFNEMWILLLFTKTRSSEKKKLKHQVENYSNKFRERCVFALLCLPHFVYSPLSFITHMHTDISIFRFNGVA